MLCYGQLSHINQYTVRLSKAVYSQIDIKSCEYNRMIPSPVQAIFGTPKWADPIRNHQALVWMVFNVRGKAFEVWILSCMDIYCWVNNKNHELKLVTQPKYFVGTYSNWIIYVFTLVRTRICDKNNIYICIYWTHEFLMFFLMLPLWGIFSGMDIGLFVAPFHRCGHACPGLLIVADMPVSDVWWLNMFTWRPWQMLPTKPGVGATRMMPTLVLGPLRQVTNGSDQWNYINHIPIIFVSAFKTPFFFLAFLGLQ